LSGISYCLLLLISHSQPSDAFVILKRHVPQPSLNNVIISPFDEEGIIATSTDTSSTTYTRTDPVEIQEEILDLTFENVELVLDEMRPFLIQVCKKL